MSLLSAILIPRIESEILKQEPVIAQFIIQQLHALATDVITWAESKLKKQGD